MPLSAGTRLGAYDILTPIGSGGMGDVYRARDTKLGRDVAIKVLPDALADDPARIARFEREARTLAALNHPHIAHIHGVEESARVLALVMELAEGLTLAERIAFGPIPIDEAMPIALQIAEALEAAHEQGIIHRDLKPANIKVRSDGMVKVLDFGLAKALDPAGANDAARLADSPTVISPAVTRIGVILGTAAYMSPEQAKGRVLDKRTDVWAFGCVLYEMLTGSRAFGGDVVQDVLAAILTQTPDWRKLPADIPSVITRLRRRCLEKDLVKRLRDIGDARLEIADAIAPAAGPSHAESPPRAPSRRPNAWQAAAAGIVNGGAIAAVLFTAGRRVPVTLPVTAQRFSMTFPASASLSKPLPHFALSLDGKAVVYVGDARSNVSAGRERSRTLLVSTFIAGRQAARGRRRFRYLGARSGPRTRVRIAAADRGTSPPPPITAWTADGRRLAIRGRSAPEGQLDLVDPDDLEHPTVLLRRPFLVQLGSLSKKGTLTFFQIPGGGSGRDVWTLEPGTTEPHPFLASRFNERGATFSPDGGWLAYAADPTGRDEIYVRAYPGPGSQIQISTDGGLEPMGSHNGREVFYREHDRMMAVSFGSAPTESPGRPRVLFEKPYASSSLGVANYDVAPDGRFVMIRPVDTARFDILNVVLNWSADITRLLPPK